MSQVTTTIITARKGRPVDVLSFLMDTSSDVKTPEFRVFFDMDTWDSQKDGLIHGDRWFIRGIIDYFQSVLQFDIDGTDIKYGTKANQGLNFVAFDVSQRFVNEMVGFMAYMNIMRKKPKQEEEPA